MHITKELIQKGLHQENLQEMMHCCNADLEKSPLLYNALFFIFKELESEYEDQAVPTKRYKDLNSSLIPLLTDCVDNPTPSSLEKLIKEFWKLKQ